MSRVMDNPEAKASLEDPNFERTCLRYGLPIERGLYVAQNELLGWSSDELSAIFAKIHGLPAASDTVLRPYFWQAQHWVKPASALVEQAANEQLALCVNARGDWESRKEGYVALSHVWDEGLYADPRNRGLPRFIIEQLFAMLQPLHAKWLWLDSLAVPGGQRDLTLKEALVKTKLINNMDNIYRSASYVVVLDSLLLRLQSQDPVDMGVTILFGQWASRVWTYQEVKLASRALILTKAGLFDLRRVVELLGQSAKQNSAKFLQLHKSMERILNPYSSSTASILDIALASANRSTSHDIDYCRGFYPCLGLKWNERYSRDRGMQYIMDSRKKEAPSLLGLHGSPLLVEGYAWAPAYLCGLQGTPLTKYSWEQKGVRREWYSHRVTSNVERHLPESTSRVSLLLAVPGPEGMVFCACALSRRERPEAVSGFKLAIENQSAFLLSESSLEALAKYRRPGPPPTVLLVKKANIENEAFIYMTAALLVLSAGVPASPKDWLIYHQSPLLEVKSSNNGLAALHIAIKERNTECISALLGAGADANQLTSSKLTPLMLAAELDAPDSVQKLLKAGARVDFACQPGRSTPLHAAVESNSVAVLKLLLESPGARKMLYWKDANGSSAESLARKKMNIDTKSLLAREGWGWARLLGYILYAAQYVRLAFVLVLLGLPTSLALDFGLLLLTGRVDIALGPLLSTLWSRYGTPVGWTLYIIVCLFSRRGKALMPKIWALLSLVRLLPFQRLKQAVEAGSFRWSTDTVFYSRLLVLALPLLKIGWLVLKKLGPFVCCAMITGGILRYFMETIFGRSSSQRMRATERGLGQVEPFITIFLTGAVLDLIIAMAFYLCWLVEVLVGWTVWEVSLHVIAIMCTGALHTLCLRPFYLGEVAHGRMKLEESLSVPVLYTLWCGAHSWAYMVMVWLLWQGSLLPGEVLLGGMTGLSRMQTYIHRLVLWITFGRLFAVFSKRWLTGWGLQLRETEQHKDLKWVALLISDSFTGAWIYCIIAATLTVGKTLWDRVSTGS